MKRYGIRIINKLLKAFPDTKVNVETSWIPIQTEYAVFFKSNLIALIWINRNYKITYCNMLPNSSFIEIKSSEQYKLYQFIYETINNK